jgi:transposase-like protein
MARGEKFWEKVLASLDAGETQRAAAERFGVSVSAIRYWVSQRRRAGTPEILPVRVATRRHVGLELEVGGVVVRLPDAVEVAYVAELVRALRSC